MFNKTKPIMNIGKHVNAPSSVSWDNTPISSMNYPLFGPPYRRDHMSGFYNPGAMWPMGQSPMSYFLPPMMPQMAPYMPPMMWPQNQMMTPGMQMMAPQVIQQMMPQAGGAQMIPYPVPFGGGGGGGCRGRDLVLLQGQQDRRGSDINSLIPLMLLGQLSRQNQPQQQCGWPPYYRPWWHDHPCDFDEGLGYLWYNPYIDRLVTENGIIVD